MFSHQVIFAIREVLIIITNTFSGHCKIIFCNVVSSSGMKGARGVQGDVINYLTYKYLRSLSRNCQADQELHN